MHDEGVDERRNRPEPRTEKRNQLGDRDPRAEHERVLLPVRQRTDHAEHPKPDSRARADDQRHERLRLHVARQGALHAHQQRFRARMRWEAAVERTGEPREVEEHVDRDNQDDDHTEEQLPNRDRRALQEVDDLVRVLADVVFADVADEGMTSFLDVDRAQAVGVQPVLQPVDVPVGVDLVGLSVHLRKVGIHPFRGRLRLTDEHGPERPYGGDQENREHEVHERDCEAAGDPDPLDDPDDRTQKQRDQQRDEEEKDDVTDRAGDDPKKQQQNGQPDQLDPARDLDLRRPGGHADDRTAVVVRLRPADWDWDWSQSIDGSLALDPAELWIEPLNSGKGGTVPRMSAPHRQVSSARSHPGRRRAPKPVVHRTRRLVVLTVVSGALLGTLFVTAFGQGATREVSQALPGPASRLLPVGPPTPLTVALHSGLRIQLPLAQTRVTAIGYQSSSDGVLPLAPLGHQGNEGALSRLAHKIFGGGGGGFVYYQLCGGETAELDVGAVPGTDVYAPVDGTVVGISDYILNGRPYGSLIEIQPSAAPSLVISLTHLSADPALTVGSMIAASSTKVGRVLDLSGVEKQALSKYTQDAGNHVAIELRAAATLLP